MSSASLPEQLLLARADAVGGERRLQLRSRGLQFLARIGEQERDDFQRRVHQTCSLKMSVGVCTVLRFLAPKRSASDVPPEQPLPKEKPQEPRTS